MLTSKLGGPSTAFTARLREPRSQPFRGSFLLRAAISGGEHLCKGHGWCFNHCDIEVM